MSWVTEILTPIVTTVVIGIMILWVLFLFWKFFGKPIKKMYKVLKYLGKVDEEKVKVCLKALQKGYKWADLKRYLLLKGKGRGEIAYYEYLFNKIHKKMKGGIKNDR